MATYNGKPGGQFDPANRSRKNQWGYDPYNWGGYKSHAAKSPAPASQERAYYDYQGTPSSAYTPSSSPTSPPGGGGRSYGGGGGGGGGGGLGAAGMAQIMQILGRKPQQYEYQGYTPQQYEWQDVDLGQYDAPEFREFDSSQYDVMSQGLTEGLAADALAGQRAYADAGVELDQYQNPFSGRDYATNQAMPDAMQRMMAANNAQLDSTETARGGEADAAFGNVLALLGGTADQAQAAERRALGGDERRFGESLASQGRTMQLGIQMKRAQALQAYEQEKWQYGESVARQNYETRMQQAMYNNQGQNQVGQGNVDIANQAGWQNSQGENQVAQGNVQAANEQYQSAADSLIQLLASGQQIDPAALTAFLGG